MHCKKCGNNLDDNSKFCNKCGNKVIPTLKNETINEVKKLDENKLNIESNKEYEFSKRKYLGAITISIINTKAKIDNNKLVVEQQKSHLGFIKGNKKVFTISLNEINSIMVKKAVDLIDGIYAIVFALVGLLNPIWFIVTAVCLWTGYGETVIIQTKSNVKMKIYAKSGDNTQRFMNDINSFKN